ncbi:MAG: DUF2179 domain-containing protein [Thermacetogeniaceae bacterium]
MEASEWMGWLLIFFSRVVDMTLATLRTLFLVRERSWVAGAIGFGEALIYIVALNLVFRHLNSAWSFFFYAGGFACGNVLGSLIEKKLAIGYLVVQVIPRRDADTIAEKLRSSGFGVTVWEAEGLEGKHMVLNAVIRRRDRERLFSLLREIDDNAFVAVSEVRSKEGGVFGFTQSK